MNKLLTFNPAQLEFLERSIRNAFDNLDLNYSGAREQAQQLITDARGWKMWRLAEELESDYDFAYKEWKEKQDKKFA